MLRIFLRAGDRAVPRTVLEKMFGRPAANAVLQTARAHGIPHGVIRQIVSGYLDGGHIHFWHHEYQSHSVPLYVELYGSRPLLEAFVTAEAELLAKCIVVFMEAEHWGIVGAGEVKR
jgi:PII-like signaling protein